MNSLEILIIKANLKLLKIKCCVFLINYLIKFLFCLLEDLAVAKSYKVPTTETGKVNINFQNIFDLSFEL